MGKSNQKNAISATAIVLGALTFGWLAIELAFKPWLDKTRAAMDKSYPDQDPDDLVEDSIIKSPDTDEATASIVKSPDTDEATVSIVKSPDTDEAAHS